MEQSAIGFVNLVKGLTRLTGLTAAAEFAYVFGATVLVVGGSASEVAECADLPCHFRELDAGTAQTTLTARKHPAEITSAGFYPSVSASHVLLRT